MVDESDTKLKDFTIDRFWSLGLVNQKIVVAISNLFCVDFFAKY